MLACSGCDRTPREDGDRLPRPAGSCRVLLPVLGMSINEDTGSWVVIGSRPGLRQLAFQRAAGWIGPRWPDPAYPQQMHLDIRVSDADRAEQALLALGAIRVPAERNGPPGLQPTRSATRSASSSAAPIPGDPASGSAAMSDLRVINASVGGHLPRCSPRSVTRAATRLTRDPPLCALASVCWESADPAPNVVTCAVTPMAVTAARCRSCRKEGVSHQGG